MVYCNWKVYSSTRALFYTTYFLGIILLLQHCNDNIAAVKMCIRDRLYTVAKSGQYYLTCYLNMYLFCDLSGFVLRSISDWVKQRQLNLNNLLQKFFVSFTVIMQ